MNQNLSPQQFTVHRAVPADAEHASAVEFLAHNAEQQPFGFGTAWHLDRGYAERWANRGHEPGYVVSGTTSAVHHPGDDVDGVEVRDPVLVSRVTYHPVKGKRRELPVDNGLTVHPQGEW